MDTLLAACLTWRRPDRMPDVVALCVALLILCYVACYPILCLCRAVWRATHWAVVRSYTTAQWLRRWIFEAHRMSRVGRARDMLADVCDWRAMLMTAGDAMRACRRRDVRRGCVAVGALTSAGLALACLHPLATGCIVLTGVMGWLAWRYQHGGAGDALRAARADLAVGWAQAAGSAADGVGAALGWLARAAKCPA